MQIAIVTFDGFNEIDSFVAFHMLNRLKPLGWQAHLVAPSESIVSLNGVVVQAQRPLSFVQQADAVLFGSGRRTLELIEDRSLLQQLAVDPARQLIGSQCSGALFLHALGLIGDQPVCVNSNARAHLLAAGVQVLDSSFHAQGNIATAGGCLAAPSLASWVIARLAGVSHAIDVLRYVAPVGREDSFTNGILHAIGFAGRSPETREHAAA
jgi:transcriptional regulator GlxA family with amidase domain